MPQRINYAIPFIWITIGITLALVFVGLYGASLNSALKTQSRTWQDNAELRCRQNFDDCAEAKGAEKDYCTASGADEIICLELGDTGTCWSIYDDCMYYVQRAMVVPFASDSPTPEPTV